MGTKKIQNEVTNPYLNRILCGVAELTWKEMEISTLPVKKVFLLAYRNKGQSVSVYLFFCFFAVARFLISTP